MQLWILTLLNYTCDRKSYGNHLVQVLTKRDNVEIQYKSSWIFLRFMVLRGNGKPIIFLACLLFSFFSKLKYNILLACHIFCFEIAPECNTIILVFRPFNI